MAVQTSGFQTWLAQRLTSYLSDELNARISIEKVSIRFVSSVVLKGVFVEDQRRDTLLYADEISVSLNDLSTKNKTLGVNKATLRSGYFRLVQYKGELHDNMHFLLDYFSAGDTADTMAVPWKITLDKLSLVNMRFSYDDHNYAPIPFGVDFSHIDCQKIQGDLRNIYFINDSVFARIYKLSFKERSGFEVDEFSADAKVSGTEIRAMDLKIRSPETELIGDVTFKYDSFPDFSEFIDRVEWKGVFKPSHVSFKDISYFATDLEGLDRVLGLEGTFRGYVNKFRGRNVMLRWGDKSFFKGNIAITGLPEIDDTYMDILAEEIQTNSKDVEWIPVPDFKSKQTLELPENMDLLGDISFKGKFTGFFSDFVGYGNVSTALGYLTSDINLKYDLSKKAYVYKGHLAATGFDVGKITITPGLGKATLDVDVQGEGLKLDNANARMTGMVSLIEYQGYAYKNLKVEGKIAKKLFQGSVETHEEDVDFVFNGEIDLHSKLPVFDFNAAVNRIRIDRLHLFKLEEEYTLQTTISSKLTGNKIDNLVGQVVMDNTFLQVNTKMYHLNRVALSAGWMDEGSRNLKLESDLLDARVIGNFELVALPAAFREIVPRYLPNVILPLAGTSGKQDFTFSVLFKNMSLVTENFFPEYTFDPTTSLTGAINSDSKTFDIRFTTPDFRYRSVRFIDLNLRFNASGNAMSILLNADTMYYSANGYIPTIELTGRAQNNRINYQLGLSDSLLYPTRLNWIGHMDFQSASRFNFRVDTSSVFIENQPWQMHDGNMIQIMDGAVSFTDFGFSRAEEALNVNGVISKDSASVLRLDLQQFQMAHLNPALEGANIELAGLTSGALQLNNVHENLQVSSDLRIQDLVVNRDTLGNAQVRSGFNNELNTFHIQANVDRGSARVIDIEGDYRFSDKVSPLDFTLRIDNFYLKTLERYMDGIVSDLRGKVSADVKLTGTLEKPVVIGHADFTKAAATVAYLNTRYNFTSRVIIRENEFNLNGVKLIDSKGNYANVKGNISHDWFSNFRFNVELYPKEFEVLNTNIIQNSLYYGKAEVTGYAKITGPLDAIVMDIALSPNKGTVINIPLNSSSEVTQSDFVTFVNPREVLEFSGNTNVQNLSGLQLKMNLEMNTDAEINLIFDERIGDVINGTGTGNIQLDINTLGDFNMYGTYTIQKGTYMFTLQNLINKKFQVQPGGTIRWGGDPYDATINMSAVYTVHTSSLYNLIQDSTFQRRIPVDCILKLSNNLMNPTINYEINVRAQDATVESMVKTVLNSEQEVSRQMFGLLVLNQFLPPSVNTASVGKLDAGAGAVASASEVLSNQVSNWLSQLSTDVNIGFNYRAKDTYSSEEIQLMFSKTMFNDRLLVETNVGVSGNAEATGNSSGVVGEFNTEYKVSKDGRFRVRAFNRSNANDLINYTAPYTQGVGVFFRQDFNNLHDLMQRIGLKKDEETVEPESK